MSHAIPVSRNTHQGPANRVRPARVLDPVAVRSSMVLRSSFLSGRWLPHRDRLPDDLPGLLNVKAGYSLLDIHRGLKCDIPNAAPHESRLPGWLSGQSRT